MRLISLNTWGARVGAAALQQFFIKYRDADVFCLQEIWQTHDVSIIEARDHRLVTDLLDQVSSWLPEFQVYFRPQYRGIYGLATLVRKGIEVHSEGELFVFKEQGFENPMAVGNHARNIQFLRLRQGRQECTVVNFHGLWNGMGKTDTEDRLLQSEKIAAFLRTVQTPFVLAGDFNLVPASRSFQILKDACGRDLVSEFDIQSTRSSYYQKSEKFADYILTSPDIVVDAFAVLPEEVSDHLALRVEFRLGPDKSVLRHETC